ncbi:MAG: hypothetical protein JEZ06_19800 [Anaerolineaceae bacterium]|nr:hypothetical protein [Anaerolineaceae bacterium]
MEPLIYKLLNIIITSPGNLVYHLTLAFAIVATIQVVILNQNHRNKRISRRLLIGSSLLLSSQLAMFIFSALSWQGLVNAHLFMPPVDRFISAFSILWIIWLWNFSETENKIPDFVAAGLSIILIFALVFTYSNWISEEQINTFNNTWINWGWNLFSLLLAAFGIVLAVIRKPKIWGIAVFILSFLGIGHALHLAWGIGPGDYSPLVRFAQLIAFPLLPSLIKHTQNNEIPSSYKSKVDQSSNLTISEIISPWAELFEQENAHQTQLNVCEAIARNLEADLCFFIETPMLTDAIKISTGYDFTNKKPLNEAFISRDLVPALENALLSGKVFRRNSPSSVELENIRMAVNLELSGNILVSPILQEEEVVGAFMLLTPFSLKEWQEEDENNLTLLSKLAQYFFQNPPPVEPDQLPIIKQQTPDDISVQLKDIKEDNSSLREQISMLQNQVNKDQNVGMLMALQKESEETIDKLRMESKNLKSELSRLRSLMQDIKKQTNIDGDNGKTESLNAFENFETIDSVAKEIRKPLDSLISYTSIALNLPETGFEEQKSFYLQQSLEVSKSIRNALNDLQKQSREFQTYKPNFPSIQLDKIIDDSIQMMATHLSKKKITMHLAIPETLPKIESYPDFFQFILLKYLENAGSITPPSGDIQLNVEFQDEFSPPVILVRVTDSGGGIPSELLHQIFDDDNSNIQQIKGHNFSGEDLTLIGLMAKSCDGKVWVESNTKGQTTFNLRIPTTSYPYP